MWLEIDQQREPHHPPLQSFGTSLGQPQNVLQGRMMRLALLINF